MKRDEMERRSLELEQEVGDDSAAYRLNEDELEEFLDEDELDNEEFEDDESSDDVEEFDDEEDDSCPRCGFPLDFSGVCENCDDV